MTAETVHTIFLALPSEEQKRLYDIISKDLNKSKIINKTRKKKPQIISDLDCKNYLLENIFKVRLRNS